ncbi:DUF5658 family protein [Metallosphaera hakonensis]|uniref:Uncharacterized protein n=1 Tax=Metallosphaera hakonensis JCM 8857 = DSM 7519 TaxID=1293036 RepID=A0A2U9ISS2_9CREN|nr:DUF5658 family protein [Metallosphaera hakonensis]AWR99111.1 hypothetical protein DFR87_04705 [Metallosphaera hakonensis JCM 8857 = DSM 7519]
MIQRVLLPVLGGLGLLDVLTTVIGLQNGYTEENAFLHVLQGDPLALAITMILLKAVAIIGAVYLMRKSMILPALLLIGLFALADVSNMLTLF